MTPLELANLHARVFTVPRPFTQSEFGNLLETPSVFLRSTTHGFALGRAIAGEAELLTLAVDPDHRRKGLGRQLMHAFIEQAQSQSATEIFLEVDQINTGAIALYHAFGFSQAGRRKGYYKHANGQTTDALVMRCTLKP